MTYERALELVREFLTRTGEESEGEPLKWTSWMTIEDAFPEEESDALPLASAYATVWRRPGAFDEGEPYPSRALVEIVEGWLGESVWQEDLEEG